MSEGIECPKCKQVGECFIDEDEDNCNNLWCNYCGLVGGTYQEVKA
tara:strand:+ start:1851 stop:1988 length:138 start_codon:yes stop_codon:yes gene_type:complete